MPKTLARGQGMAWMRKRAFIRGYAPSEGGGFLPHGFQLIQGADGALLKGADGALLYGKDA